MAHIVETTQTKYAQKLAFSEELDATVMEVGDKCITKLVNILLRSSR